METIKNIFIDSLTGFSTNQIPLFLFQLLCAGLAAQILQLILNKKMDEKIVQHGALIAVSIAVLASIAKYKEPIAIMAAAAILLLFLGKDKGRMQTIGQFLVVLIGIGCGVGSVVQTAIGCIIIFGVILFIPLKK